MNNNVKMLAHAVTTAIAIAIISVAGCVPGQDQRRGRREEIVSRSGTPATVVGLFGIPPDRYGLCAGTVMEP